MLLRSKELLDAAEIGKLRPRWEGPFRVTALAGPITYTLALPMRFQCSPTANVKRLKPHYARTDRQSSLDPVTDFGESSADVSWELVEHLTNCMERLAEYEAAAMACRAATRQTQARGDASSAPSNPPPHFLPFRQDGPSARGNNRRLATP